jgi:hypothetical protein
MASVVRFRPSFLIVCITLAACSGKKAETPATPAGPADSNTAIVGPVIPEAERLALDSANSFYRAKAYPAALEAYRRAAQVAPKDVAPWFGVYMVATATQNKALGDSAIAEMRARGGEAPGQATDSALKAAHKAPGISPTAH